MFHRISTLFVLLLMLALLPACLETKESNNALDGDATDGEAKSPEAYGFTKDGWNLCAMYNYCYEPFDGWESESCTSWFVNFWNFAAKSAKCTDPGECEEVHAMSCGCTRNLVLNKELDQSEFWDNYKEGNPDCGIASTCDCPPADGFACEQGFCVWNYDPNANCICREENTCCDGCSNQRNNGYCLEEEADNNHWPCCLKGTCSGECTKLMLYASNPGEDSEEYEAFEQPDKVLKISKDKNSVTAVVGNFNTYSPSLFTWDIHSGVISEKIDLAITKQEVYEQSVSDDGSTLAICSKPSNSHWEHALDIDLINPTTGDTIKHLGTQKYCSGIALSPDASLIAIAAGKFVKVLDTNTGHEVKSFPVSGETFMSVDFSANGKWLAAGEGNGAFIFDTSSWKQLAFFAVETGGTMYEVRFSPDNSYFAVSLRDKQLNLIDTNNWQISKTIAIWFSQITAFDFSEDGSLIAVGNREGSLLIKDIATSEVKLKTKNQSWIKNVIIKDDAGILIAGSIYNLSLFKF